MLGINHSTCIQLFRGIRLCTITGHVVVIITIFLKAQEGSKLPHT